MKGLYVPDANAAAEAMKIRPIAAILTEARRPTTATPGLPTECAVARWNKVDSRGITGIERMTPAAKAVHTEPFRYIATGESVLSPSANPAMADR